MGLTSPGSLLLVLLLLADLVGVQVLPVLVSRVP